MSLPKLTSCHDGMCGADDCPRCHPGCERIETCIECGSERYSVHITDEDRCPRCGEFICEQCDMDMHKIECGG